MDISAIVPCYNEEKSLALFYQEFCRDIARIEGVSYELILVDDGSTDGTLREMKELAAKDSHVRYLSFSRNFGKESAIYAGLENARGDFCVLMDADLQDPWPRAASHERASRRSVLSSPDSSTNL